MYADELLRPWYDRLAVDLPGLRLLDAHTHIGDSDPDGFRCAPAELLGALALVGARAVVFPMHEPGGYPPANDRVIAEAEASGGALVPFCRLDPARDAPGEAMRCLDAGARGIKLHPRAERFTLGRPELEPVFALAAERRVPVLVHAGRGIPALGRDAVDLCERHPGARLILGHAGISDLAWIWRRARELPNLFFDTSWWSPADFIALFSLVPPGQVLFASDAPYGTPLQAAVLALRCGRQAGLSPEQLLGVAGAQLERLVGGEEALDLGPSTGRGEQAHDVLLDRVAAFLVAAVGRMLVGDPATELIALARLACEVGEDAPQAAVCRSVLALLDRHREHVRDPAEEATHSPGVHLVITALCVACTPDVALPREPEAVEVGERQE